MNINVENIFARLKQELTLVCQKCNFDLDNIVYSNEQVFNQIIDNNGITVNDKIYMVISFGQVTPNGLVSQMPCTIKAITMPNNIDILQNILMTFCEEYNLSSSDSFMLEMWSTPVVEENFKLVGNATRSIMTTSGVITITDSSISDVTLEYNGTPIFIIQSSFTYDTTVDVQTVLGGTGLTNTLVKSGIRSLTFMTYLNEKNSIVKDMSLAVLHNNDELRKKHTIRVKQFGEYEDIDFVLTGVSQPKQIGSLASVQLSFSEGGL